MQTQLKITGMHCDSCKRLIESVVKDIPGVDQCEVDFDGGIAVLTHNDTLDLEAVKAEIATLGDYTIEVI